MNGGTNNGYNPKKYNYDYQDIELLEPTKTGYTFLGWTSSELTNPTTNVVIENNSVGDKAFTANWKANTYTITYDVNGGDEILNINQEVVFGSEVILLTPTRGDFIFNGWFCGEKEIKSGIYSIPDNVTITANWRTSEGLIFSISNYGDGYELTSLGTCEDTEIIIPAIYNEKPVVSIADGVFLRKNLITSVNIPSSVEHIGYYNFIGC